MDLLAEILEPHLPVGFGMRLNQGRQHALERCIGVVEILEIEELGDERAPFALGDAHREEDEERVEPGLLDLDPSGGEELRHHRRRNAEFLHAAVGDKPGRQDGDLDRVDQDMIFSKSFKSVPAVARFEHPLRPVVTRFISHRLRLPDIEPP